MKRRPTSWSLKKHTSNLQQDTTSHGQTGSAGEDVGKVGPSLEMTQRLGKTGWYLLKRLKTVTVAVSLLGANPRVMKTHIHIKAHSNIIHNSQEVDTNVYQLMSDKLKIW